jgi:hypothetical protein
MDQTAVTGYLWELERLIVGVVKGGEALRDACAGVRESLEATCAEAVAEELHASYAIHNVRARVTREGAQADMLFRKIAAEVLAEDAASGLSMIEQENWEELP